MSTATPHHLSEVDTSVSAGGESSSEQQHKQAATMTATTMTQRQMSKAAHDGIFDFRAATAPICRSRSTIVVNEEEGDDLYHHYFEQQSAKSYGTHGTRDAIVTNDVMTAATDAGRSMRMIPVQIPSYIPHDVSTQAPTTQASAPKAAPTALPFMLGRRSNSADANNSGSISLGLCEDDLDISRSRFSNGSISKSSSAGRNQRSCHKLSPKSKPTSAPHGPNDPLNHIVSIQQQQQQQAYGNAMPQPQYTAMRYNSSPHSTLGGYLTGMPPPLTHPSVPLELISRDRARWEADYYSGYGMDYGYDYEPMEGGYYGGSPRSRGVQQVGMRDLEQIQEVYQPRMHHSVPHQQQHQQQEQVPHLKGGEVGELPGTPPSSPHQMPAEINTTPSSRKVYQERDYRTDRVWQEDDHSCTPSKTERKTESVMSRLEGNDTEKLIHRENDETRAPSPPSSRLIAVENSASAQAERDQKAGVSAGHLGSSLGQQAHHMHQGVVPEGRQQGPQALQPVPQLRAENGIPVQIQRGQPQPGHLQGRGGSLLIGEHGIYEPMHAYYQAHPSTLDRAGMNDPRVHHVAQGSPAIYPNGHIVHPQYGLIYPPTPGGSMASPVPPPPLAGVYPQQDLHHQGRGRLGTYQQVQPSTTMPQAHTKAGAKTSEYAKSCSEKDKSNTNAPVPASATPQSQTTPKPKPKIKPAKGVSFSHLEIRTYETILGDNPGCSSGPSLGIGWRYDPKHYTATVDEHKAHQNRLRGLPDGMPCECRPEDLVLDRTEREAMLLKTGYTRQDLADSVRALNKAKNKRMQTVHNLRMAFVEERVEVVNRTLTRWIRKKERTRQMYEDWKKKDGNNDYQGSW